MFRHFNSSKKVANVIWVTVGVLPVSGFYDFSLEFDIQNDNVFREGRGGGRTMELEKVRAKISINLTSI